jgi:hypothetical protein
MDTEVRIGARHAEPLAGLEPRQDPVQEEVAARIEAEVAEVEFRVGSRRRSPAPCRHRSRSGRPLPRAVSSPTFGPGAIG